MNEQLNLTGDDIGKIFMRDAKYRNSGKVRLLELHGEHFCTIEFVDAEIFEPFESMINRLTRIDVADEKGI